MDKILNKILEEIKKIDIDYYSDIFNIYNFQKNSYLTYYDFLDEINYYFYNKNIDNNTKKHIFSLLDYFYNKYTGYAETRLEWIIEAKKSSEDIILSSHHLELKNYFIKVSKMLNENNIDYFHASGFMGYLLTDNPLERYHHDIDLYINFQDLEKLSKIFNDDEFVFVHTFEESSKGIYRHGYKIENKFIDIPIWLSFYERNNDNSMYICEYYENDNGQLFTKKNYNSQKCCKLSLIEKTIFDTNIDSLSIEAIYQSKGTKRKKDIYDRNILEPYINKENVEEIEKEICYEWEINNNVSQGIKHMIKQIGEKDKDEVKLTKKRI